jgi:hypothetical protein
MRGLPPDLARRLRETLSHCGPFDSDRFLRAAFVDARLSPWRDTIPEATSRAARVDALIEALLEQTSDAGDTALALFCDVLVDRVSPGDACRGQLAQSAVDLRRTSPGIASAPASTLGTTAPSKYTINIHGGQVGAIGDNAHVEGGIHFGAPPAT